MALIKVSKFLNNKTDIKVSESILNYRKVYEIQLAMAKVTEQIDKQAKNDPSEKVLKNIKKIISKAHHDCENFVNDFLNLNSNEKELVNKMEQQILYKFVNSICVQFLGINTESKESKYAIGEVINQLENSIEDLDYEEQISFTRFHILPEDFEKQNFKRLQVVLKAKAPEDRVQDITSVLSSMGISPSN